MVGSVGIPEVSDGRDVLRITLPLHSIDAGFLTTHRPLYHLFAIRGPSSFIMVVVAKTGYL